MFAFVLRHHGEKLPKCTAEMLNNSMNDYDQSLNEYAIGESRMTTLDMAATVELDGSSDYGGLSNGVTNSPGELII